jgi:hypothetical protein
MPPKVLDFCLKVNVLSRPVSHLQQTVTAGTFQQSHKHVVSNPKKKSTIYKAYFEVTNSNTNLQASPHAYNSSQNVPGGNPDTASSNCSHSALANLRSNFQLLRGKPFPNPDNYIPYGTSYVSAPAGAGKTYQVVTFIVENLGTYDRRFIYAAPTVDKANEFEADLRSKGVTKIRNINSHKTNHVTGELLNYLKSPEEGCVLITTHEALKRLPFFPDKKNTLTFLDELPQIDKLFSFKVKLIVGILKPYLQAKPIGNGLAEVVAQPGANIDILIKNHDTALVGFIEFMQHVKSQNYNVYVWQKSYDRIFNAVDDIGTTNSKDYNIQAISILAPSMLSQCCILAAGYNESMLHNHLVKHGRKIEPATAIVDLLWNASPSDSIAGRTKIYYCLESDYRKKIRDRQTTAGTTVRQATAQTIGDHIGSEANFLLYLNKDDKGNLLLKHPGAELLPGKVEGLNKYSDFTNVVFIAALNRTTPHYSFLKALGYDREAIERSTLIETAYQVVCRGDIRNKNSQKKNSLYFADRKLAWKVAELLGISEVHKIGSIEIVPQVSREKNIPFTQSQLNKRHKILKAFSSWEKGNSNLTRKKLCSSVISKREFHTQNGVTSEGIDAVPSMPQLQITLQTNYEAKKEADFLVETYTLQDFVSMMRRMSTCPSRKSEAWRHFTLTTFKVQDHQDGYRRIANFDKAYGLILDFDGGSLSKEQFCEIFWNRSGPLQKRSFIICNSVSRSQSKPNHYHVIFPFQHPCDNHETYKMIYNDLTARLHDAGYEDLKEAGLDPVGASGVQTFRMPCLNIDYPAWQFFETYGTKSREFAQHGINPGPYNMLRTVHVENPELKNTRRTGKNESAAFLAKISTIENRLNLMTEGRRSLFFSHAALLWHNGYDMNDVYGRQLELAATDQGMRDKAYENIIQLCRYKGIRNRLKKR